MLDAHPADGAAAAVHDIAPPQRPAWSGVAALSLSVFGLVTAEFLPPSVLTPLASDLGVSLGAAGQAVTATAVVGAFAALLVPVVTSRWDRRLVLLGLLLLLGVSNLMTAAAVNLPMLLAARVVLGVSLGGFWSMAATTTMRLVPSIAEVGGRLGYESGPAFSRAFKRHLGVSPGALRGRGGEGATQTARAG